MFQEIEMKFLVKPEWKSLLTGGSRIVKKYDIKQGYLSNSPDMTVRVRLKSPNEAFLTIKGPRVGISCAEFEYDIPYHDAEALIDMCSATVQKTRYVVEDECKQKWEVDEFHALNEGFIMAEIELDSEEQAVALPDWVTTDVSTDSRYTNAYLVNNKAPVLQGE